MKTKRIFLSGLSLSIVMFSIGFLLRLIGLWGSNQYDIPNVLMSAGVTLFALFSILLLCVSRLKKVKYTLKTFVNSTLLIAVITYLAVILFSSLATLVMPMNTTTPRYYEEFYNFIVQTANNPLFAIIFSLLWFALIVLTINYWIKKKK